MGFLMSGNESFQAWHLAAISPLILTMLETLCFIPAMNSHQAAHFTFSFYLFFSSYARFFFFFRVDSLCCCCQITDDLHLPACLPACPGAAARILHFLPFKTHKTVAAAAAAEAAAPPPASMRTHPRALFAIINPFGDLRIFCVKS